jgi:hypothetical protein
MLAWDLLDSKEKHGVLGPSAGLNSMKPAFRPRDGARRKGLRGPLAPRAKLRQTEA